MTKKRILIALFCLLVVGGLAFLGKIFIIDKRINAFSGIKVDSIPQADIYLDTKFVGKTPYENSKMVPGEYTLKMSVSDTPGTFYPWQTKIKLVPQSFTYVNRTIGKTDSESAHQIVWLEKLPNKDGLELAVVSSPDNATIEVDGLDVGTTSKIITSLSEGDHSVKISKTGFSDQVIDGKLMKGFRLNVSVKLGNSDEKVEPAKLATDSAKLATGSAKVATSAAVKSTTANNPPKPYIMVNETGLGFLRVRFGPTASSSETGQVNVGDKFPMLSESSGWTQIKIGSSSGWVSDQYVEKIK